jgi:hypothetical protein
MSMLQACQGILPALENKKELLRLLGDLHFDKSAK